MHLVNLGNGKIAVRPGAGADNPRTLRRWYRYNMWLMIIVFCCVEGAESEFAKS